MKKLLLVLFAFAFIYGTSLGQTTIFTEDFDNNSQYSVTLGAEGNDGSSDYFQRTDGTNIGISYSSYNGTYFFAGQDIDDGGWTGSASPSQLTWSSININGYTSLEFKGYFGSAATDKIDDNDYLHVEYRIDGGSWTNLIWFENDGTQYNTYFLEDTDFDGDGDGTQLTSTLAEFTKSISATGSSLDLRFTAAVNSGGEDFAIDYFRITGTGGGSSNDQTTEVYEYSPQIAAGTIYSTSDTQGEAVDVFKMTIEDQGSGDGLPTHVTNIRVTPYSTNTADWTNTIQGVTLNDGSAVTIGSPTITDTYIDIPISSGNLDVPDGGSKDVTLAVYLNTSNINDGDILSFEVVAASHGFTADASGSDFATSFALGDFNSNDFTIEVDATQLTFTVQPSNVMKDSVMSPSVKVAYTDENENIDTDYDGAGFTIGLTTTGTFSGSATTSVDAISGISTFDNLVFSATGKGLTLTANDNSGMGNTSATSNTFDVTEPYKLFISEVSDPGDDYNGRFVELYNAGTEDIDLGSDSWYLTIEYNGGSSNSDFALTGTIKAGETYVTSYSTSGFIGAYGFYADDNSGFGGSGDDGYYLYVGGDHTTGTLVDAYGEWGVDGSSQAWEYTDSHAVRNTSVTQANSTWTSSEWTITSADVADMTPGTHGDCITWNGSTDATWSTANNWVGATTPSSTKNVKIPDGATNFPSVDGTPSSPTQCNHLTIDEDASITIPVGKALTVLGDLTNKNMGLSGYGVIVKSNSSGNGSLIVEGSYSGNYAQVERYFNAYTSASDGWHEIACPLTSFTVNGTSWDPTGTNNDLYYWSENDDQWINYKVTSFDFEPGKGYLTADEYTETRTMEGTLNNSSVSFSDLSYTPASSSVGWHLLGNPFPCAITYNTPSGDWGLVDVSGTAKVWRDAAGNYSTFNAGDEIPSTNAFFVEVANATNNITIPLSARTHSLANNYKNQTTSKDRLIIKVTNDVNTFFDENVIGFKKEATKGYDISFDSHKLFGVAEAPQLWSVESDELFSDNYYPYEGNIDISLYFKAGVNGSYHLNFTGINSFYTTSELYLEDRLLNKTINLKNQQTYDFNANTEDDNNRFVLHFYNVTSTPEINNQPSTLIYTYNNSIIIKSDNNMLNGNIEIVNLLGQVVYKETVSKTGFVSIRPQLKNGVYVVRYQANDGFVQSEKVILQ